MSISNDYMAGLFDGEGWFSIRRAKGSHYGATREWAYQCLAALTMREKYIVDEFQKRFGGTVVLQKSRSDKHSPYWKWQVNGLGALAFAEALEPHLQAKRSQAIVLIQFQREKIANGNQPIPDERYAIYENCYKDMKRMNEKGIGK